jgi:hypothetical protein
LPWVDHVIDTTNVVKIKLNNNSCKDYPLNDTVEPDLEIKHLPLAQALLEPVTHLIALYGKVSK